MGGGFGAAPFGLAALGLHRFAMSRGCFQAQRAEQRSVEICLRSAPYATPILRLSREASLQSFGLVLAFSPFPDGAPAQEPQGVRPSFTPKCPSLLNEDLSSASPTG